LHDVCKSLPGLIAISLCYDNSDKIGGTGKNSNGIPNKLMPYVTKVAVDNFEKLINLGDNYDTPDVREFIQLVDLAE